MKNIRGNKIALKNESEIMWVLPEELICAEISRSLLTCKTAEGELFKCTMTLKAIEGKLPSNSFMRISKNCLINLQQIRKFCRQSKVVILLDGAQYKVSSRKTSQLLEVMRSL